MPGIETDAAATSEPRVGSDSSPRHRCHAINCETAVPPKMLMCRHHWFRVPMQLRRAVWVEYRPGQEIDKRPSAAYLEAMEAAIAAVAAKERAR